MNPIPSAYPSDVEAIVRGRHGNPFVVLGMQGGGDEPLPVNAFLPAAATVTVVDLAGAPVA